MLVLAHLHRIYNSNLDMSTWTFTKTLARKLFFAFFRHFRKKLTERVHYIPKGLRKGNPFRGPFAQLSYLCIYYIYILYYIMIILYMHIYIITSKALEMFRPSIACPQTQQTWWPDFKWQVTSVHWQSMTSKLLSNGALGLRFTSETSGCSESPWPQTGKGQWLSSQHTVLVSW